MRKSESLGRFLVTFTAALVFLAGGVHPAAAQLPRSIFTSTATGATVNANIYDLRTDVYLNGGPQNLTGAGLPDGTYYFQVTDPSGSVLLSSDNAICRQLLVAGGRVSGAAGPCPHPNGSFQPSNGSTPVQLYPYDFTPNPGGTYKVWLIAQTGGTSIDSGDPRVLHFLQSDAKTDNFKVSEQPDGGGGGPPQELISILGSKFYDTNTNGTREFGEPPIPGWRIEKTPPGPPEITYTDVNGIYGFLVGANSGSFTISEVFPAGAWLPTTATSALVGPVGTSDLAGPDFGNICVGAGGGRTVGFWSNRNGQALFGADDLALMNGLNLKDGAGNDAVFADHSDFRAWLLGASATNMAYMLSAQLAAMQLNVLNGFVSSSALVYAPGATSANAAGFATVSALMAEADAELGLHPITFSGSPFRSYQEALKNALDQANNSQSFVQPVPCAFITPY